MASPYPTPISGARYSVISTHVPTQSDELYIIVGDVVVVKEAYDDGWCMAVKEKTKQEGLIPSNFIVPFVEDPSALKASSSIAVKRVASLMVKPAAAAVPPVASLSPAGRAGLSERERQDYARARLRSVAASREGRERTPSNIGALRILVVGDSGIGKTGLIESFFRSSDVVDSDPVPVTDGVPEIRELRGSTIPAAELHTGEEPFNLTLVDTPGYGAFMDASMVMKPVVDYLATQFAKTDRVFVKRAAVPNLVKFLNAGTGCHTHIDVALYCILHRLKPADIEYMRQLSALVTIVPVLLKGDTMRPRDVFALKASILEDLTRQNIPVYGLGLSTEELLDLARSETPGAAPFVVASLTASPPGALAGTVNEFEVLKRTVFYSHVDDLRELSAE
ncbi:hypothetical protein HK405_012902, partial [Cladochytrium tenue]